MKTVRIFARVFFTYVFSISAVVYAQDNKNCEAAVDAAASMNMNQKECDYSDKGLNGFLQKAFKRGEEGATLETGANTGTNKEAANKNNIQKSEEKLEKNKSEKVGAKNFLLSLDVLQWSDTSGARIQLLSKAMEKCGQGFTVLEETYRILADGSLGLAMRFECVHD